MCQKDSIKFLHDLTSNRKEKGNYNYFMFQMRIIMLKPEKHLLRTFRSIIVFDSVV